VLRMVTICSVVLEKRSFKWAQPFCIFFFYLPFEEDLQTWIPFTQGWFVPNLTEICQLVLENKIFDIVQKASLYFHSFFIISHWRRMFCFIWTKLNPFPLRSKKEF
jgi:hypothetical protein